MQPTFYDKKTCGTCKKAQVYLNENKVEFEKVDIIDNPPNREVLEKFIDANNVKPYLNSRSAIYRDLKLGQNLPDKAKAIELMLQDPNLIKRPFIIMGDVGSFGFVATEFDEKWGTSSK
ncbi:MAG: Spx/MgsR family RNA polymerase-binding regulatory protein [Candidatus Marinimicrobia bacterium]|nr:Spx/MgsR family RNA polymerase-binding regulatory protein [Candidatus Neomarinimicrobiota bacterium]